MDQLVAIVTGASRAMGRATAIRVARDFCAIVVVARSLETLQETLQRYRPKTRSRLRLLSICASTLQPSWS